MKIFGPVIAVIVLCLASLSPVHAASPYGRGSPASARTVIGSFRLQVSGSVARDATFWVAYGPIAGRWGIVRLHHAGHGVYRASHRLPAEGTTIFTYLQGYGVVSTRLGPAPGNPVVTITRLGPLAPSSPQLASVTWQAPVG